MRLVVGTGNLLRGDDSVGQSVARAVADAGWPDVLVIASTQLAPEHAAQVAQAELVIFVDAEHNVLAGIHCREAAPGAPRGSQSLSHHIDPEGVLSLALALYGQCPRAWLIGIPCEQFAFGDDWSARTATGAVAAYAEIAGMLAPESQPIVQGRVA